MANDTTNQIKVDRIKLLSELGSALEVHRQNHALAEAKYRAELRQDYLNKIAVLEKGEIPKTIGYELPPISRERAYIDAINTLEYHIDPYISYDQNEFRSIKALLNP